jgi:hypothetical protein
MTSPPSAATTGRHAAWGAVLGVLVSGPLALLVVNASHPQPPWQDAASFARHYHPIQIAPYFGGMLLIGALVMLISSTHTLARSEDRPRTTAALIFTAGFTALIFLNYVLQTTFVPALVQPFHAENATLIAALSMSNPRSVAWGIEMWGWGLFGVATWLVAPVFRDVLHSRVTARLLVANGTVSVVGALWTTLDPGWPMTTVGLVAFAAWNLLLLVLAVFAARALSSHYS